MDVPFDQPFTGYGAAGAAPAAAPTAATGSAAEVAAAAQRAAGMASPTVQAAATAARVAVPSWLKTAGGFGVRNIAAPLTLGAQATGAYSAAAQTTNGATYENRPERALKILGGADITGLGARIGNLMTGGDFTNRDAQPDILGPAGRDFASSGRPSAAPTATTPAAAPVATADSPMVFAPAGSDPGMNTGAPRLVNGQPYQAVKRSVGADGVINITGSGAPEGYGATARDFTGGNAAASFFQAGAHIKEVANNNALHMQGAKLMLDSIVKGAEANKNNAQAGNYGVRTNAAIEHLASNPGDYAGAGAVAAGRAVPGKSVFLPTMSADKVDVGNTRTGEISRVTVPSKVNEADIQSTMKSRGMTREQVIKRLKDEGRM